MVMSTFKGIIDKSVRDDGVIEPLFIVVELQNDVTVDNQQSEAIERGLALQRRKANAGFQDVDNTLQTKLRRGIKPHLIVIHGSTSEAVADIGCAQRRSRQLPPRLVCYNITTVTPLSARLLSCDPVRPACDCHYAWRWLALEILMICVLQKRLLLIKSPLITAMGHAR